MEDWSPKTHLGQMVKSGKINDINKVLDSGMIILESEITDALLPGMDHDLLMIGQSKGKFGGGRRRIFRQTQKKTREGNKPKFAAYAVIGNKDGIVGVGYGKARETVPARDKAIRRAKLNVFKIARGSGSWESHVDEPHTIPFAVEGKCGSVTIRLIPAPKGKGLVAEKEVQKILSLAGIKDVWSRSFGQTKNKINLIKATEDALRKLMTTKVRASDAKAVSIFYGAQQDTVVVRPEEYMPETSAEPAKAPAAAPKAEEKPAPKKELAPKAEEPKTEAPKVESADAVPLSEVKGVGATTQKKLADAGITSANVLASTSAEELVDAAKLTQKTAEKIIAAAQAVVGGAQ